MNDLKIIEVATAPSAESKVWKNKKLPWSEFKKRIETPQVTAETFAEFKAMAKKDAGRVKDVGGFVGGFLRSGRRSPANVQYRTLLTLDIDFGTLDFWEAFCFIYECEALLHGTHSHSEESPRYRLLIPLSRECAADEYSALSRKVAGNVGIEFFDNTTFEINRLMFWPSVSKDVEYYYRSQAGPLLDVDGVLGGYKDWRDVSEWPTNKKSSDDLEKRAGKQEDPTEKRGIVGAFCRTYSITDVLEKYLADVYDPGTAGRYTYREGSTANGLVVYSDLFAYSHHGTDPCGGLLSNAFDLVRVHKFKHLDAAPNSLKSFKAMEEFALQDKEVKKLLAAELKKVYASEFDEELPDEPGGVDEEWVAEMDMDSKGQTFLACSKNIDLIFENDPFMKKLLAFNLFDGKPYIMRTAPWRKVKSAEPMKNVDFAGLRNYIEKAFGISAKDKINDSLELELNRNAWHPIRQYLDGLVWDQTPRVDSLLFDYFGCDDSAYHREAIRKSLCGAVARIYQPGCKFDLVPVLIGEEGIRKSTFWGRLGKQWFSDTFLGVEGKESLEQIQGAWIIEIAELAGFRKSEAETIKHFISKSRDEFRPAYGKVREIYPRQCIFVGTTNRRDFLKDPTGNRRFLPIDTDAPNARKSIELDLVGDEIDQIWAEAVFYYMQGEKLYLSEEVTSDAKKRQSAHLQQDDRSGLIEDFLDMLLPDDWGKLDNYERHDYFCRRSENFDTVSRTEVTVAEVWCECLGKAKEDMSKWNTREINDIIRNLGWVPGKNLKNVHPYGRQRYFTRPKDL